MWVSKSVSCLMFLVKEDRRHIINEHRCLLAVFTHVAAVNQSGQQHRMEKANQTGTSVPSHIVSTRGPTGVQQGHRGAAGVQQGHQGSSRGTRGIQPAAPHQVARDRWLYCPSQTASIKLRSMWLPPTACDYSLLLCCS